MSRKGNRTRTEEAVCIGRARARITDKGQVRSKTLADQLLLRVESTTDFEKRTALF